MSNKTSDGNVANIQDDVKIVKEFIDYAQGIIEDMEYERPVDVTVYQKELTSMTNILAERELKNKRIQELEEENKKKSIELICYQEELDNSILEQAIKDKIEKLKNDYDQKYDLYMGYKVESREQQDILKQMSILQELLEGG